MSVDTSTEKKKDVRKKTLWHYCNSLEEIGETVESVSQGLMFMGNLDSTDAN